MKVYLDRINRTYKSIFTYYFDFGYWYVVSIGDQARGHEIKSSFIDYRIPYNKEQYPDYYLRLIEVEEVPSQYKKELLTYIFSDIGGCFLKIDTTEIPEV